MASKRTKREKTKRAAPTKRKRPTRNPEPRTRNPASRTRNPIASQTALARKLRISQPAVSKMIRHADWPFGTGPWQREDLPAIAAWRAEHLRPDPATTEGRKEIDKLAHQLDRLPPKAREEVRKLQLQVKALERMDKVAANELHDVAACNRRHVGFYEAAKGRLLELISAVPDRIDGLKAKQRDELRGLLTAEIDAALAGFAEDPPGPFRDT